MGNIATAGNTGEKVRSDCFMELEIIDSIGLNIELKSKVAAQYGDDIRKTALEILNFFGIENARLYI